MATVITSLGSNTSIDTETPTTCSGSSSPYTVQFGTDPTGVSIGDIAVINDSTMASEFTFLITNISGSSYTLTYMSDDSGIGDTSPCDMYNEMFGQASATFKRAYSTVAAWEADLDDSDIYSSGDIAKGEMYPDSTFSTNFGQVGGGSTVGLLCKVLTAATAHRHNGTESGSHVKVTQTSQITHTGAPFIMSWLDISGSGGDNRFIEGYQFAVTHCIIHDVTMGGSGGGWPGSRCVNTGIICNNIIYNIDSTTTSSWGTGYYTYLYGIWQTGTHMLCDNNTVYKVHSTNSWGGGQFAKGIIKDGSSGTAGSSLRNNIAIGTATDTEGTNGADAKDFNDSPTATFTHNLSSDSSADGSNSITGESAADLFVSNSAGSEDLHLKSGAAALGAGTDLGTTYSTTAGSQDIDAAWDMGPQFDIDNRDRDTEGDTWDIGADQCHTCSAGGDDDTTNAAFMLFFD